MSHTLAIGATEIPYTVRESNTATRKRLEVTPDGLEAVVPLGTPMEGPDGLLAFLAIKKRWIYQSIHEVEARHRRLLEQRYASGAKIQYRGRWLMLNVETAEIPEISVECRSKFHIRVPRQLSETERLEGIRDALRTWLKHRAEREVGRRIKVHAQSLGVQPAGFRLNEAKRHWGSCGKSGMISIHWRLIQAPTAALDYVVAHEVAHLRERNHTPAFWETLALALPNWRESKKMLETWEVEPRAV